LVKRWMYRLLVVAFVFSLATLSQGGMRAPARAQAPSTIAYFPIIHRGEQVKYDNFTDEDPVWQYTFTEVKDGVFFHRDGRYVSRLEDNSAIGVAWPGWRPLADFQLEVDARFKSQVWGNGLGIVFSGNDVWTEYYAFMLVFNFAQHFWSFARVDPPEEYNRFSWGGAPSFVGWYKDWNHLMAVRIGSSIRVYCNGILMPGGEYTDSRYGTGRLVGLLATTYEGGSGEIEYDNFTLTPR
jgi:hypothetical protein